MLLAMSYEVSFGGFINLFYGMVFGVVIYMLFLIVFVLRGSKKNLEKVNQPKTKSNEEILKKLVMNRQDYVKRNVGSADHSLLMSSYDLIEEISRYFFPKSDYPMLEITIDEVFDLLRYISDRVEEIIDRPVFRRLKNVSGSQIQWVLSKKRTPGKSVSKPNKWNIFSKVYKKTQNMVLGKLNSAIIGIVGEEAIKIYSKKVFNQPIEINVVEEELNVHKK